MQSWPQAVSLAQYWVHEAERQSLLVRNTPDGVGRRIESDRATGYMAMARGSLATLEVLRPGDPEVEELRRRLNHCPVLQLVGTTGEAAS